MCVCVCVCVHMSVHAYMCVCESKTKSLTVNPPFSWLNHRFLPAGLTQCCSVICTFREQLVTNTSTQNTYITQNTWSQTLQHKTPFNTKRLSTSRRTPGHKDYDTKHIFTSHRTSGHKDFNAKHLSTSQRSPGHNNVNT